MIRQLAFKEKSELLECDCHHGDGLFLMTYSNLVLYLAVSNPACKQEVKLNDL